MQKKQDMPKTKAVFRNSLKDKQKTGEWEIMKDCIAVKGIIENPKHSEQN